MASRTWFSVEQCPRAEQCTEQAFKRAKVWGWTEQECRDQLYRHLRTSGFHQLSEEDAGGVVDSVALKDHVCFDEATQPPFPPPGREDIATTRKACSPATSSGACNTAAIVAETLRQAGLSCSTPQASTVTTLEVPSVALHPPQNDTPGGRDTNRPRRADLIAAIDALKRAVAAARQCSRLSLAAAEAFNNEASVWQESQGALETLLRGRSTTSS